MELETLDREHPKKKFLVHDGYCPWMYGVPMDPDVISVGTAQKILEQITGKPESKLIEAVQSEGPPPLQYAEKGDELYRATNQNRFIVFMDPSDCVSGNARPRF